MESDKNGVTTWRTHSVHGNHHRHHHTQHAHISTHSTNNVLRARRGVVRMLMVVVLTFALCNLPLHARKMWQYWWACQLQPIVVFLTFDLPSTGPTTTEATPISTRCSRHSLSSRRISTPASIRFYMRFSRETSAREWASCWSARSSKTKTKRWTSERWLM